MPAPPQPEGKTKKIAEQLLNKPEGKKKSKKKKIKEKILFEDTARMR
jgi:hypothetical protein